VLLCSSFQHGFPVAVVAAAAGYKILYALRGSVVRHAKRKMRVSLWNFIASNFSRGHYVILIIALLPLWAFILNNYYILIIALVFHRQTLPLFHQCVKVIEIIIHCWMRTKYEIRRMKRRVKTFFRKAKQVAKDVLQGIILVSIFSMVVKPVIYDKYKNKINVDILILKRFFLHIVLTMQAQSTR
jgi:hypothetical protein